MKSPKEPPDETERLAALASYQVLDTQAEPGFDGLTKLAAHLLDVPIALVSIVAGDRQWFKSSFGVEAAETAREVSFCGHVVAGGMPLIVTDASTDPRFANNPFVAGAPHIRFYAGIPLRTPDGHVLGTLCALDYRPRELTAPEQEFLRLLSLQVMDQLELHRQRVFLAAQHAALLASQQKLHESEGRLRALFDALSEGVVLQDGAGAITSANPSAERILGLSFEQMIGRKSIDPRWSATHLDGAAFPGEQHPAMVTLRTGAPATDVGMRIEKPSGERTTIRINTRPLLQREGGLPGAVVSTFRDTTQEEATTQALSDEKALLSTLLSNLPGISVTVFDDRLRMLSTFGLANTVEEGISAAAYLGKTIVEVEAPENRAGLEAAARRCLAGKSARVAASRRGRQFEVLLVPLPADRFGWRGLLLSQETTVVERLREQMARQQRLVTTGTLAAGVGHEINNPLSFVASNLEYLLEELRELSGGSPSMRMRELIRAGTEAKEGADRIRKIVRGLQTLARADEPLAAIDVRSVLEISANMAMHEIRPRATLKMQVGELPLVLADEAGLSQVFVNLLVNAAQAFATADPARNRIWARGSVQGDRLVVEIEDNGPGIALEVLPRIFDPFFTTKPVGQGTGLGLSISYNLVAALGGELTCSTVLGKGTCFRASLPRAVGAIREQDAVAAIAGSEPRGRVLVIDDEEAVLAATARLLLGAHEVVAISDPREALRRLLSGKEQFDVVFCDLMMPYLTGIQVYRRVREESAELADRFVFVSGGVTREEVRIFLDEVPNERLEKPFSSQNLRGIVRRLVGRRATS